MALRNWFSSPFKFSVVPVSVLLVVVYGVVFTAVSVTDGTPDVPDDQKGLDLQQAYEDLHRVSAQTPFPTAGTTPLARDTHPLARLLHDLTPSSPTTMTM